MVFSMHGEAYFQHFQDIAHHIKDIKASPMLIHAGGELALKLADLYFLDSLPQVGTLPEPEVIGMSRDVLADTQPQTGKQLISKYVWAGRRNLDLDQAIEPGQDSKIDRITDPEEKRAYASMVAERDSLNAGIAEHHDTMLSRALVELHKHGTRGKALDEKLAARIVKESVNGQRKQLAEILAPWQTILLAHYDRDPKSSAQAYSLDVIRNRNVSVPKWLLESKDPDGPSQLFSSFISETETLVALNEWVVSRGVPYLPVIAPVFYESGHYDRRNGNPHADLFLCSLVPGRNDIIPIQVKKLHKPEHEDDYIRGMVFLTPQDLGQCEYTNTTIKINGRAIFGHRLTLRYGAISTQFIKLNARRKGQQPTKVDRKVYAEQLEKAFEGLDCELGNLVLAS